MLPAECGARVGAAEEARLGSEARNEEVRSRFPQSTRLASVRRKRRDRDRRRGMKRSADASRRVRGSRRCGGRSETGIGAGGNALRNAAPPAVRSLPESRTAASGPPATGNEAFPGREGAALAARAPAGAERAQRDGCPGESRFPQGFTRERRTEKRPRSAASPGRSRAYLLQPAPAVVGSPAAKTSCAVSPDGPRRREVRRRGMQGGDVRPGRCISRAGRRFRHERCPASTQQALRRREAPQAADRIGKKPGRTIAIR